MMRKYGKTDTNQGEIVAALEKAGCMVFSLASIGGGMPDLLVGRAGVTWGPYEIKSKGGKLTPAEIKWWEEWRGGGCVVFCAEDILRNMGMLPSLGGSYD